MQNKTSLENFDIRTYYLKRVLECGRSFPKGIWKANGLLTYNYAAIVTRTLIEEVLKWSDYKVMKNLNLNVFKRFKLGGMIQIVFNSSVYAALNNAYPGKYKPWQLRNVPIGYWNKTTEAEATRWLIEDRLKLDDNVSTKKLSKKVFLRNGLYGMLNNKFNGNVGKALDNAYPTKPEKQNF